MTIMNAAASLALSLGPPAYHSVFVNTSVGDDKEFIQTIHVAVRPQYKSRIKVPTSHEGYPVTQVPWPKLEG